MIVLNELTAEAKVAGLFINKPKTVTMRADRTSTADLYNMVNDSLVIVDINIANFGSIVSNKGSMDDVVNARIKRPHNLSDC